MKDGLGPVLPIVVLYAIFIHSYSSTTKLSSIFLNHDFLVGKSHLIFSLIWYPVICFNLNGSLCNISTSSFNFQAEALHECRELRQATNKNIIGGHHNSYHVYFSTNHSSALFFGRIMAVTSQSLNAFEYIMSNTRFLHSMGKSNEKESAISISISLNNATHVSGGMFMCAHLHLAVCVCERESEWISLYMREIQRLCGCLCVGCSL